MNRKLIFHLVILALAALTWLGFVGGQYLYEQSSFAGENSPDSHDIPQSFTSSSITEWASTAMTVQELISEADLVVLVRVSSPPVTRAVPIYPLDQQGNKIESAVLSVLFSDTEFEVIKTYVGTPLLTVTVMQTGGTDPTVSKGIEEMADDPLYKIGEEYILFLMNISGDPIHAPDRELYIIVNPFGRYRLNGGHVFVYGQNPLRPIQLPARLLDLETQIEQAKDNLGK